MNKQQRDALRMPTNVRTAMEGLGADPQVYEDALDKALTDGVSESEARRLAMTAIVESLPAEHAGGLLETLSKVMESPPAVVRPTSRRRRPRMRSC
ncbi:hypothetical protein D3C85_926920 [compost metagenome]